MTGDAKLALLLGVEGGGVVVRADDADRPRAAAARPRLTHSSASASLSTVNRAGAGGVSQLAFQHPTLPNEGGAMSRNSLAAATRKRSCTFLCGIAFGRCIRS